jgi:hypothetical protein
MPLSLRRLPGPKLGELDWRERAAVRTLLPQAELDDDPREILQEATAWLERRVVDRLVDEVHAGADHLREIQFRYAGLDGDLGAPAAGVAALAWLRCAEAMLEGGMEPEALVILVGLFPTRDEAEHAPSG